ncbi:tRNA (N6-threonylcarbamoyladenosine(37)-N6)-methyltransferase TrmO [Mesorhizobium sp. YIM 152430]|uniref:tRNA (N6-threonylcarbamoyladenosine(37)-N6)-methyltransferase TrmO n=1 Tax=Mesorhizobium sp. YIM 152430 TaxID=3031761 RepID=UPI0023DCBE4F|nr:tRNA (N6-threonylcarbamoyladenosine(37)-N6)-methyltransferase TrmO [Mesorhizobium sp. YIM 152430]MDF1598384.1 tRNA (N6-threonylcarbamoyladenosine(37)-N6)-methyltransferase TrmO [Mesorhizobium sp. YIM 152430]
MNAIRDSEEALTFDPVELPGDGHVVFIGRIASPWASRADCPKNMAAARDTGRPAQAIVDEEYRRGLLGLESASHVILLTWLADAGRNLIRQRPRHRSEATGTFALRSPVRPNPIGLHVVRLLGVDEMNGILDLEAIDVLDGTPLLDIKPYFASTDAMPDAIMARRDA